MVDAERTRLREHAHEIFDPIAEGFLTRDGVDIGQMFASEGLRIRGKIFAFVSMDGGLMIKVPEPRTQELIAAGDGERMVMRGSPMREWVIVPATRPALGRVDGGGLRLRELDHARRRRRARRGIMAG